MQINVMVPLFTVPEGASLTKIVKCRLRKG